MIVASKQFLSYLFFGEILAIFLRFLSFEMRHNWYLDTEWLIHDSKPRDPNISLRTCLLPKVTHVLLMVATKIMIYDHLGYFMIEHSKCAIWEMRIPTSNERNPAVKVPIENFPTTMEF